MNMQFFRMRLILALIVGVTLVSVGSTYFEVLAHKHMLRRDLERRTAQQGTNLLPEIEEAVATGQNAAIAAEAERLRSREAALGLAVFDSQGKLLAAAGQIGRAHV